MRRVRLRYVAPEVTRMSWFVYVSPVCGDEVSGNEPTPERQSPEHQSREHQPPECQLLERESAVRGRVRRRNLRQPKGGRGSGLLPTARRGAARGGKMGRGEGMQPRLSPRPLAALLPRRVRVQGRRPPRHRVRRACPVCRAGRAHKCRRLPPLPPQSSRPPRRPTTSPTSSSGRWRRCGKQGTGGLRSLWNDWPGAAPRWHASPAPGQNVPRTPYPARKR